MRSRGGKRKANDSKKDGETSKATSSKMAGTVTESSAMSQTSQSVTGTGIPGSSSFNPSQKVEYSTLEVPETMSKAF